MTRWTSSDIPSQRGRTAVITGTGGLGYEDALALAASGGEVILAGRDAHKGSSAVRRIREQSQSSTVWFEQLDLADLASVARFADRIARRQNALDILINNAGVMTPPERLETADGFELQLGTNYLGHVALTAGLIPLLQSGKNPRVVTVSSIAAPRGSIDFADLNAERGYDPMSVYAQSKLACLMFAFELERRSEAAGWGIASMAAHPGVSRTELIHNGAGRRSMAGMVRSYLPFLFQPVARGALPTLYAATSPDARPGGYYGPNGIAELRGYPTDAKIPPQALDQDVAARLWDVSLAMTGARFESPRTRPAMVGVAA
jgi:NAD(P)-dependent dehydrogenase (short-subunit alcohol dehydrogenase family)